MWFTSWQSVYRDWESSPVSTPLSFLFSLSLQLFPSSLIIIVVETQRPQLSMQSAALITLFHNSSKRKPGHSEISLYPDFFPKPHLSLSLLKPFFLSLKHSLAPFLCNVKTGSVTDAMNFCLAGDHTALSLPGGNLKSIKTSVMKLM